MKQGWGKQFRGRDVGAMGIALIVGGMAAQPAFAKIKAAVETTVRLGYDSNPFLSGGTDLASGSVEGEIRPSLTYVTPTGQAVLSGYYDHTQYLRRYGGSDEYGATLDTRKRVSPSFDVFLALRYDSSVIGQSDDVIAGQATTPPIDDTDVNLIGQRQRSNVYSAQGGFNYKIGPKDSISADGGATYTRYPGRGGGSNSDNYGARVSYNHAISPRTKIGISGQVYKIDYDTPGLSTMVLQPSVTFSTQLSATWTFDASAGVSFSDLSLPLSPNQRSTSWSGSANLCHKGRTNHFCFYGSRSVSASGFGGTTVRTQGAVSFEQDITSKLSATANASYAQSKSQAGVIGTRDYVSMQAGLSNRFTRRFKMGVDARYRDVFGSGPGIRSDIGGEVSATLALPGPS